jgi:hypothetical protein
MKSFALSRAEREGHWEIEVADAPATVPSAMGQIVPFWSLFPNSPRLKRPKFRDPPPNSAFFGVPDPTVRGTSFAMY